MNNESQWTEPDLESRLDDAVDDFRIDSQRWEDPEAGKLINELADRIARFLLEAAHNLVAGSEAEKLRGIPDTFPSNKNLPLYPQVFEAIQIRIAAEYLESTWQMTERSFDLLRFVVAGNPKEQVRGFLARVARCYILGLAPECAVFCRASIENALNEKYHATGTEWPRNERGESPAPLRIQLACDKGWLSAEAAVDARTIWTRGSKSAHADVRLVKHARDTVAATSRVIAELYA
ncbi:MAG: hypothetical protein H0T48_13740 [Gemmatimonadaceae bacterium]|nr:hypothetical protein [Gemmatimonadaceae bacterium]